GSSGASTWTGRAGAATPPPFPVGCACTNAAARITTSAACPATLEGWLVWGAAIEPPPASVRSGTLAYRRWLGRSATARYRREIHARYLSIAATGRLRSPAAARNPVAPSTRSESDEDPDLLLSSRRRRRGCASAVP